MMHSGTQLRLAGLVCLALGAATLAAAERGPSDHVREITSRLDQQIPKWMAAADVNGLTVAVVEKGELVWSGAYGMASVELDRPATRETIFEAASLGKVVFALIVLRLADQGVIDLDESLATDFDYPLLDHDVRFRQLTPRLILQHASGLPNWGGYALDKNRDPVEFKRDPGSGYDYSGEAYTALQAFVAHRVGRDLEELFRDLAEEAGMTHSSFLSYRTDMQLYAQAMRRDGHERAILEFEWPGAAYSLVTTAEDLARFITFHAKGGGLSDAAYNESLRSWNPVAPDAWGASIPAGAEIHWTLTWGALDGPDGRIYFHGGNNGEFRSFFAWSPQRDIGVALMANGAGGLSFLPEVFDPLVGDLTAAAVWWGYEEP